MVIFGHTAQSNKTDLKPKLIRFYSFIATQGHVIIVALISVFIKHQIKLCVWLCDLAALSSILVFLISVLLESKHQME